MKHTHQSEAEAVATFRNVPVSIVKSGTVQIPVEHIEKRRIPRRRHGTLRVTVTDHSR